MKHEFSPHIFEKYLNISFMNIHPVGAKLFHVDRQDTIKLIIAFHNFGNTHKNEVQELTDTTHFLATTCI
jgi:UDP-galactopyranose mutase